MAGRKPVTAERIASQTNIAWGDLGLSVTGIPLEPLTQDDGAASLEAAKARGPFASEVPAPPNFEPQSAKHLGRFIEGGSITGWF